VLVPYRPVKDAPETNVPLNLLRNLSTAGYPITLGSTFSARVLQTYSLSDIRKDFNYVYIHNVCVCVCVCARARIERNFTVLKVREVC